MNELVSLVCGGKLKRFIGSFTITFRYVPERHWRGKIFPMDKAESSASGHPFHVEKNGQRLEYIHIPGQC